MRPLRLALVVHGRFHIFDLGRELIRQGHDVTLFTNYPRPICERFGVPRERVVSFLAHGVGSRVMAKLLPQQKNLVERGANTGFGRWAARAVPALGPWDAVASMSGIAEDLFHALGSSDALRMLMRGSVHIREQKRILADEERAGGGHVEQPSDWIVAREEREYEMADVVQVLSPFARESFLRAGVPREKLDLCHLGVNVSAFTPPAEVIDARLRRLATGEPLRVICAGNFSRQKGARFWHKVFREANVIAEFRFVGSVARDAIDIARSIGNRAEFRAKVAQASLPKEYAWADLFVLPTLQDGFAMVVSQALAAGLPVVTTTSCGASALVEDGLTGWIIPPGSAEALGDCLKRLDADRGQLIDAVHSLRNREFSRDWADVAREFAQSIIDRRDAAASVSTC